MTESSGVLYHFYMVNGIRHLAGKKVCLISLCFLLAGCLSQDSVPPSELLYSGPIPCEAGSICEISLRAPSIGETAWGDVDSDIITCKIYLPLSYQKDSDRRFPVVYFLDSLSERPHQIDRWSPFLRKMPIDSETPEFIIIEPSVFNPVHGLLIADSAATGNWETAIVKDVVSWADNYLRTIPDRESRVISGFYTGAASATLMAMKYPDTFGHLLAFSPALIPHSSLRNDFEPTWFFGLKAAYGAAFSPDPDLRRPFAEIPVFDNSDYDREIIDRWHKGFGNLEDKVLAYSRQEPPLSSIKICAFEHGAVPWVYEGCRELSALLNEQGITHSLYVDPVAGDAHELVMVSESATDILIPFMQNIQSR